MTIYILNKIRKICQEKRVERRFHFQKISAIADKAGIIPA